MRLGKVSLNVLKRSVLKWIVNKKQDGASVGTDCAIFSFDTEDSVAITTNPVTYASMDQGLFGVYQAIANLSAAGAIPKGILVSLLLPKNAEEVVIQNLMKQIVGISEKEQIPILGGHTEVTSYVTKPLITITGIGAKKEKLYPNKVQEDMDVVVSKWIGLDATILLARREREKLLSKYPARLIDDAAAYDKYLSVIPEAAVALKSDVCIMHDISQGGILGALWELAERAGVGLDIDLKKIPIKQETVEICEYFDLNPYELMSGGSLIMIAADGEKLVSVLENEGISATIVGRTTNRKDRIIRNGEEIRYLDLPKSDEIFKYLETEKLYNSDIAIKE